jgi:hypothetical protein
MKNEKRTIIKFVIHRRESVPDRWLKISRMEAVQHPVVATQPIGAKFGAFGCIANWRC